MVSSCSILAAMGAYFGGGVGYNVVRRQMPLDMEAVPHIDFWRALPGHVVEGGYWFLDWVLVKLGKREPRMGPDSVGVDYEWNNI
jgi:hypothetical protein